MSLISFGFIIYTTSKEFPRFPDFPLRFQSFLFSARVNTITISCYDMNSPKLLSGSFIHENEWNLWEFTRNKLHRTTNRRRLKENFLQTKRKFPFFACRAHSLDRLRTSKRENSTNQHNRKGKYPSHPRGGQHVEILFLEKKNHRQMLAPWPNVKATSKRRKTCRVNHSKWVWQNISLSLQNMNHWWRRKSGKNILILDASEFYPNSLADKWLSTRFTMKKTH